MDTGPFVRVEQLQGCAWVILDRPPLNPIVPDMVAGLKATFQMPARDPSVRAAIVTGAGRAMTAGMQLQFLLHLPAPARQAVHHLAPRGHRGGARGALSHRGDGERGVSGCRLRAGDGL